jgi:HD-like signal output (HDOD) protein
VSQGLVIAIIVVVAVLVVAGLVVAGLFLWRRSIRRYIAVLIGKRAGVGAALKTVEQLVAALAEASDGEMIAFAVDASAEERKTLEEVAEQMAIVADELATMPLPKQLWDAANALADAATALTRQTGALSGKEGIEALDALSDVDLVKVRSHFDDGVAYLAEQAEHYDVDATAVYGGGLYI